MLQTEMNTLLAQVKARFTSANVKQDDDNQVSISFNDHSKVTIQSVNDDSEYIVTIYEKRESEAFEVFDSIKYKYLKSVLDYAETVNF